MKKDFEKQLNDVEKKFHEGYKEFDDIYKPEQEGLKAYQADSAVVTEFSKDEIGVTDRMHHDVVSKMKNW
tara:strand:- start:156 stop:365 length:210 start_codon:yes stop_codon:yes gene_type:complete